MNLWRHSSETVHSYIYHNERTVSAEYTKQLFLRSFPKVIIYRPIKLIFDFIIHEWKAWLYKENPKIEVKFRPKIKTLQYNKRF